MPTGTTTPCQSETKSNGNEGVTSSTQSFRTEVSLMDIV